MFQPQQGKCFHATGKGLVHEWGREGLDDGTQGRGDRGEAAAREGSPVAQSGAWTH